MIWFFGCGSCSGVNMSVRCTHSADVLSSSRSRTSGRMIMVGRGELVRSPPDVLLVLWLHVGIACGFIPSQVVDHLAMHADPMLPAAEALRVCDLAHLLHDPLLTAYPRLPHHIKSLGSMAAAGMALASRAALSPRTQVMTEANGGTPCRPSRGKGLLVAPPGSYHRGIVATFQSRPDFGRAGQQWRRKGQEVHS
jgi:hypothetical protein